MRPGEGAAHCDVLRNQFTLDSIYKKPRSSAVCVVCAVGFNILYFGGFFPYMRKFTVRVKPYVTTFRGRPGPADTRHTRYDLYKVR